MPLRIALYQPEIPQNTGTILRLAACMGVGVDLIEPLGFIWNHPNFKRAVMDYLPHVDLVRHVDFEAFLLSKQKTGGRIIPVVVSGETSVFDFTFQDNDTILFGKESIGIPFELIEGYPSLTIPMPGRGRSLNLAIATTMVTTEAMRQLVFKK